MISFEPCTPIGKAWTFRKPEGHVESVKAVGASLVGMTACPCVLEYVKGKIRDLVDDPLSINLPLATHVQRVIGTVVIEVPKGFDVDVMKIARIIQESMSPPTYGLLKRVDEAEVGCKAVSNPKFAEDVVRSKVKRLLEEFRNYPDTAFFESYVRSEESIHKHDIIVKQKGTIGELRSYLANLDN